MKLNRILTLSLAFLVLVELSGLAQSSTIATYVGPGLPISGEPAVTQPIDASGSVFGDDAGGFYVASPTQNRIYRVAADGTLTVIAGNGTTGFGGDGGPAQAAQLWSPQGIAVDGTGNLLVADTFNHRIRKVTPAGVITTMAGNGVAGFSGDGGPASSARLNHPNAVAVDPAGNLFIADTDNNRIRKVTPDGIISTVGGGGTHLGDGGAAVEAWLWTPTGVAVDAAGNLFIADAWSHRVRTINPEGVISTAAGSGSTDADGAGSFFGDGDPAATAGLNYPWSVAVDRLGNLFIADTNNHRIRKVTREGIISTVAGTEPNILGDDGGFSGDGGAATSAQLNFPRSVAVDVSGNLFIADAGNRLIKKVTSDGIITAVAGTGHFYGDGGPAQAAQLSAPHGIAMDSIGNLFIADSANNRIRKVTPDGVISTIAGTGTRGFYGDGGPAQAAQLSSPWGVAVDTAGNLFIADSFNNRIRKVTSAGVITTIAGNGTVGFRGDGGPAQAAQLSLPAGVAADAAGNLFIADTNNHRIRKVTRAGTISTIAGTGTRGFAGDGGPAQAAQLSGPWGVAVGKAGNLFIADRDNDRIRKVAPAGIITTVAGTGINGFSGDGGPAEAGRLDQPFSVVVDAEGNLFIADTFNHSVRKVTTTGVISTIAGTGINGFSGEGGPAEGVQLYYPAGVAVNGADNLFISDSGYHRIYEVTTMTEPDLRFEPETIRVGGSFTATFLGPGLTAETYLDLRFRSPGDDKDQVILNWQRGILGPHAAIGAIPGHWTVIGVRPHRTIDDHTADFTPVSATLTVVE